MAYQRHTQYFGKQVTLTGTVVANLWDLLKAIDENIPPNCRELSIQMDGGQAGTLLIGDAAISTTVYGVALVSTSGVPSAPFYMGSGSDIQNIPLGSIYLLSSVAAKVNVLGFA